VVVGNRNYDTHSIDALHGQERPQETGITGLHEIAGVGRSLRHHAVKGSFKLGETLLDSRFFQCCLGQFQLGFRSISGSLYLSELEIHRLRC
jgi:hypothetical protein